MLKSWRDFRIDSPGDGRRGGLCFAFFVFLLGVLEGLAGKGGGVSDELVGFEAFQASGRIFLFHDIVVDFFRSCYQKDIINWFLI